MPAGAGYAKLPRFEKRMQIKEFSPGTRGLRGAGERSDET